MKKWIHNFAWALMAFVPLSFVSCDDDNYIARTLEGTWEGNMYTSTYWNDRYYDASYSQVCFLRDPYTYSSGTGYWVDYYDDYYWGNYNYVASHIEFTVKNGVINIYFVEDKTSVSIYNYRLNDNYFEGYIELWDGEKRRFQLEHISSPNWNSYDRWGYDYYYDDYYYGNENAVGITRSKAAEPERPVRVFRDRK